MELLFLLAVSVSAHFPLLHQLAGDPAFEKPVGFRHIDTLKLQNMNEEDSMNNIEIIERKIETGRGPDSREGTDRGVPLQRHTPDVLWMIQSFHSEIAWCISDRA